MKEFKTTIEGRLKTHIMLWSACMKIYELAKEAFQNKKPCFDYQLTTILLTYLTYEAYLNYLGSIVAPDEWQHERNYFNSKVYRGHEGKLKKICEKISYKFNKSTRPYQTIKKLSRYRNLLVHGKPELYRKCLVHKKNNEPSLFGHAEINKLVSHDNMVCAIKDIEDFVEKLNYQAKTRFPDELTAEHALYDFEEESTSETIHL